MSVMRYDKIIIGAGPAGLMASIVAAEQNNRVLLVEQLNAAGRKLLSTGGGRCNITNILPPKELSISFTKNSRFTINSFYSLPPESLIEFFENRNVPIILTDDFHYFPKSGKATDVLNALLLTCKALNVDILYNCKVDNIIVENSKVKGISSKQKKYFAPNVIIATGGKGYPSLGSNGSGYYLAKTCGHSIITPLPALCGVDIIEKEFHQCAGISLLDVTTSINLPKEKQICRGELLFTQSGISAFAVLDLAGRISELLQQQNTVPLKLNLFSDKNENSWHNEFEMWKKNFGTRSVKKMLAEYLPQKLINILAPNNSCKVAHLSADERNKIIKNLCSLKLNVNRVGPWEKAMITRGGVAVNEIDAKTMESKIVKGLFFAGEVVDIDGPCGGFNLQWAFSSGYLSGIQ